MAKVFLNNQNNNLYLSLSENKYRNLRTGKEGIVDKETAGKVFVESVEGSFFYDEMPEFESMISELNLKAE